MFQFIKKVFSITPKKTYRESIQQAINEDGSGVLDDPDFGIIQYDEPYDGKGEGIWQMIDEWSLNESRLSQFPEKLDFSSSSILGNNDGPYDIAREFILSKLDINNRNKIWDSSESYLKEQLLRWLPKYEHMDSREIFMLTNIATHKIENNEITKWEVVFGIKSHYIDYEKKDPDISIHLEFNGKKCTNVSVDT